MTISLAAVLTLVWRQMPSVRKLARLLAREDQLWSKAVKVSQQAVSQRFLEFSAELFERVLSELLPSLSEVGLQMARRLKHYFANYRVCKTES